MSEVKRIGSQLKRAFEGVAWHGPSLREILAGVNAEQAASRPLGAAHSIWEIVLHIEVWQSAVRRGVEGEPMPAELSTEKDWPPVNDASEAAWQDALAKLESSNKRLRDALRNLTDADLDRIVEGRQYSFYFMLHGAVQHSLYHAGQIALLKRASTIRPTGEV